MAASSGHNIRRLFICIALLLFPTCLHGYDSRCPQGLPFTVRPYQDRCFQFVEEEKYWNEARTYCMYHGGKLVKIDNPYTSRFIKDTFRSLRWTKNGVWIGLHDRLHEMHWQWVTKSTGRHEAMTWNDWGRGHPGSFFSSMRDCVRMYRKDGWRWHEAPCRFLDFKYRFICEYDMLPTTTTTTTTQATTTRYIPPMVQHHHASDNRQLLPVQNVIKTPPVTTTGKPTTTDDISNEIPTQADIGIVPDTLARTGNEKEDNPVMVPSIVACGVLGLIAAIVFFLLIRRRRKRKFSGLEAASFSSAVYVRAEDEQPCGDRPDAQTPGADEGGCSVDISGLKTKRVQNHYVIHESDKNCEEAHNLIDNSAATAAEMDNDLNNSVDATDLLKRPLPVPEEEPYEVPVQRSHHYLPMDGSPKKLHATSEKTSANHAEYLGHEPASREKQEARDSCQYDAPKPTNIYAEIPSDEEFGNIYETLDSVRDKVEQHYVNS